MHSFYSSTIICSKFGHDFQAERKGTNKLKGCFKENGSPSTIGWTRNRIKS